jgi:hypothetical protein
MPVTRKPKAQPHTPPTVDPLELINRGGSTPAKLEKKQPYEGTVAVVLRLPTEMLDDVDRAVQARPLRIPRHTWILEAVLEKLTREQNQKPSDI